LNGVPLILKVRKSMCDCVSKMKRVHAYIHTHIYTYTRSHTYSLPLSLSLSLSLSLYLSLYLSLSLSLSCLSHTHTHTQTHLCCTVKFLNMGDLIHNLTDAEGKIYSRVKFVIFRSLIVLINIIIFHSYHGVQNYA